VTLQNRNIPNYILEAANRFRDHEGININKVRRWAQQFGDDLNLLENILKNINYYSSIRIREAVEELINLSCKYLKSNISELLFVPIGSPHEGSGIIARAVRGINGVRPRNFKYMSDLAKPAGTSVFKGMILIDDFSGTGERFLEWWRMVEGLILPWELPLVIGLLVLNCKAKDILQTLPAELICVEHLDFENNVFLDNCEIFTQEEKNLVERYCRQTRCPSRYIRGRNDCGLLLAFRHGCPNNSLPILWYEKKKWINLFKRRGI
jgi:hypothetical protein